MLLEAPDPISRRLLRLIWDASSFCQNSTTWNSLLSRNGNAHNEGEEEEIPDQVPAFYHRHLKLKIPHRGQKLPPNIIIYLIPSMVAHPDPIFTSLVLHVEHAMIQLQTLTAWYATLGGGYFFCRRLTHSLALARQQRLVALHIGNSSMARQCSINESYNLIYAGRFGQALKVLGQLELEATLKDDKVIVRQCQAARLLTHRLKKMARRLKRYHATEKKHATVDDYQRIRIVEG